MRKREPRTHKRPGLELPEGDPQQGGGRNHEEERQK